MLRTISV